MQYYIIELSTLQTGIDTICKNVALVLGIWIFQKFLIKKSWRITSYGSTKLISLFSLLLNKNTSCLQFIGGNGC